MKPTVHFWSYVIQIFLEWEMFPTKVVEKNHDTLFIVNNLFFLIVSFMR